MGMGFSNLIIRRSKQKNDLTALLEAWLKMKPLQKERMPGHKPVSIRKWPFSLRAGGSTSQRPQSSAFAKGYGVTSCVDLRDFLCDVLRVRLLAIP